jgi:uncharacterized repeat protein (TIGR01451 family)
MKKFYFYLAGIALLASGAEMFSTLSGDTPASQEWVVKPEKDSGKTPQKKMPFARAEKKSGAKAVLAPGISATNTFAVTNGGNTAGGELEYTVVISNAGPNDATGTLFTETIDNNTTLVAGSLKVSPIAVNDNYSTIGNVGFTIAADQGILANDVSPTGTALVVSSSASMTTTQGGTVTITAASGAFNYEPAAGFEGSDTFTYTIQNGSGLTATGTVTILVKSAIWFINDDAAGGGTGTLTKPFNTISAFQAINDGGVNRPQNGHSIFIFSGNYDGSIIVRSNQKVFGQGSSQSLLTLTGLSAPSGSHLLPATGGMRPSLTSSGGNVFTLLGAATVQGLNIGNSSGAKFASSATGRFTASEIDLTGTGVALNISGKELAAAFGQVSSSVNGGTSPVKLSNVTGNLTFSSGTLTAINTPALDIAGAIALNLNLTAVNADGGSKGLIISGTSGSFQIAGSGTTPGSGGTIQNITQRGIELLNTAGITFKNINLVNASQIDGAEPLNGDNTNANAAVYGLNVNGLSMDRVNISGTVSQEGINLRGSSNFNFTNGSIGKSGSQGISTEGCIFAVNTGGTNSIVNSTLSDPGGRVAYFANFSTNMAKLTVDNSVFQDADGASGLQVIGYGSSVMNVKVMNNSRFLNCRTSGIEIYANENSFMTTDIRGATVDPGTGVGRGLDVAAFNNATTRFHIEGNNVKHYSGIGINTFAFGNGSIEGTILNNTTENIAGSNGVSGIVSSSEGVTPGSNTARGTVLIQGNTIKNATNIHGISIQAINTGGALSNFTLISNKIEVTGTSSFFYGIDVNAPDLGTTPNNSAKICANVTGNAITLPTSNRIAYRARAGSIASEIRLQGTGSTVASVWNAGGNTPVDRAIPSGGGTFKFNQTCPLPGAISLREIIAEDISPERTMVEPVVVIPQEQQPGIADKTIPAEPFGDKTNEPVSARTARTETVQAGETVTVNGTGSGFTLPQGKSTTIKFKVTINNNIAPSVCQLSTQGMISGSNFSTVLTDDPGAAGSNNPTITIVTSTPVITFCPGNQTIMPDAGTCTSIQTLAATVDACPAATITYSVNGNPITFPYAFPAGATTVQVTASNGIGSAQTCSYIVTVSPTPAPPVTDEPDAQTICAGAGTSFSVASSQANVTYQWQKKPFGGAFANISVASNPTADDATLMLTSVSADDIQSEYRSILSNPCNSTISASAILTVNEITGSSLAGTATVSQGTTAPLVTFKAAGGTLPYTFTYHVNGGSNLTVSTTDTQATVTVSQPTNVTGVFTYELVSVSDAQSCFLAKSIAQRDRAVITVVNDLTATISGTANICKGDSEPVITFKAVNGIGPFTFTYSISGGANQTVSTTGSNTTVTVSVPTTSTGTYSYNLINVSGAGGTTTPVSGQTAAVSINETPAIALTGEQYQCMSGQNTYTVFFTASPGAVITSDKGVVNGNTVTGIPSNQTAIITATLGTCSTPLSVFKSCALPVTLISFEGTIVENNAVLKWKTTQETNSELFEIQRSKEGKNWQTAGTEKSHGESSIMKSYSFVDKNLIAGDNYYRLKMIDRDQTFAYSQMIKVHFTDVVLKSEFHPNPVSDVLYLTSTDWSQVKSAEIHNLTGTLVYRSGKTVSKTISVQDLPVGMYILTIIHSTGQIINQKVLINR